MGFTLVTVEGGPLEYANGTPIAGALITATLSESISNGSGAPRSGVVASGNVSGDGFWRLTVPATTDLGTTPDDATITFACEAAGFSATSAVPAVSGVVTIGTLAAVGSDVSPNVVSVSSGTPEDGQFPKFTGVGSEVIPVASPGGGGGLTVVPITANYDAAIGDFAVYSGPFAIADGVTASGSPTLTSETGGFTDDLVGQLLDDYINGNGSINLGTTVLSVESSTSLTMSENATADGSADYVTISSLVVSDAVTTADSPTVTSTSAVFTDDLIGRPVVASISGAFPVGSVVESVESATSLTSSENASASGSGVVFGVTVTLPDSDTTGQIAVESFGPSYQLGDGGSPYSPVLVVGAAEPVALYGPGVNGAGVNGPSLIVPFTGNDGQWVAGATLPLPTPTDFSNLLGPYESGDDPIAVLWDEEVHQLVPAPAVPVATIVYHSSTDADDILQEEPTQNLSPGNPLADSTSINAFAGRGFIDHLPAAGHAGPTLIEPIDGTYAPGLQLFGWLYVVRIDGTASCAVQATGATLPDPGADPPDYNMDSTLLDWDTAIIQGTDLTADATNHWVHSTAGGLCWFYSTFYVTATG